MRRARARVRCYAMRRLLMLALFALAAADGGPRYEGLELLKRYAVRRQRRRPKGMRARAHQATLMVGVAWVTDACADPVEPQG